ncbi:MAG: hypothetical protein KAS72_00405 [Phycisphaerales bacterium]|nr:hypothetical protein [Phycisphaerales bacterium]
MTGKHVRPVQNGETQPRRASLAIGLALLTGVLCLAVLLLSGKRRGDLAIRQQLAEVAEQLAAYGPMGEPIILDGDYAVQSLLVTHGPLRFHLPSGYAFPRKTHEQVAGIDYVVAHTSKGNVAASYGMASGGEWQMGLVERLTEYGLEPPTRLGDRGVAEYVLSHDAAMLADQVQRPRHPVRIAQQMAFVLSIRGERLPGLTHPRPFALGDMRGFVQEATADAPSVYAIVFIGNWVAAEMRVYRAGRLDQAWSVDDLNEAWPALVSGIERPASGPGER